MFQVCVLTLCCPLCQDSAPLSWPQEKGVYQWEPGTPCHDLWYFLFVSSGHSRWLLSVHSLPDQCLLLPTPYTHDSYPTYFVQAPVSDCSHQKAWWGMYPSAISLVTPYKLTISSHQEWRLLLILPTTAAHGRVLSLRTLLFQMCKPPHSLNHWCLCCWLWALSWVLKLWASIGLVILQFQSNTHPFFLSDFISTQSFINWTNMK